MAALRQLSCTGGALSRPQQGCCAALGSRTVPARRFQGACAPSLFCAQHTRTHIVVQAVAASQNQQAQAARAALEDDADACITCSDGEVVYAHAAVLRLASPVWRDELEEVDVDDDMAELEDVDASSEVMEVMLCRLYPTYPQSKIDWDNVEELGHLAHKLQVACVLRACEVFLLDELFQDCQDCDDSDEDCDECEGCDECEDCTDCSDSEDSEDSEDGTAEIKLALDWLKQSEDWGMGTLADHCSKRLLLDVDILKEQLRDDEYLDELSDTTVRRVLKLLASNGN